MESRENMNQFRELDEEALLAVNGGWGSRSSSSGSSGSSSGSSRSSSGNSSSSRSGSSGSYGSSSGSSKSSSGSSRSSVSASSASAKNTSSYGGSSLSTASSKTSSSAKSTAPAGTQTATSSAKKSGGLVGAIQNAWNAIKNFCTMVYQKITSAFSSKTEVKAETNVVVDKKTLDASGPADESAGKDKKDAGKKTECTTFNQQMFSQSNGDTFGKNACATTSALNVVSKHYTEQTGKKMTASQGHQAVDAAIKNGAVSANDATVKNWNKALNVMAETVGLPGSFAVTEDAAKATDAFYKFDYKTSSSDGVKNDTPDGVYDHHVACLDMQNEICYDPYAGSMRSVTSMADAYKESYGGTCDVGVRYVTYSSDK